MQFLHVLRHVLNFFSVSEQTKMYFKLYLIGVNTRVVANLFCTSGNCLDCEYILGIQIPLTTIPDWLWFWSVNKYVSFHLLI